MPLALAQPKAALVGLPFASNAALIAGPFTSISLSACLSARSVMNRASLQGVAYHFELEKESEFSPNSFTNESCNDCAKVRRDFGGNSSVPNSNNKFLVTMTD